MGHSSPQEWRTPADVRSGFQTPTFDGFRRRKENCEAPHLLKGEGKVIDKLVDILGYMYVDIIILY
jgi:hypothetical protein